MTTSRTADAEGVPARAFVTDEELGMKPKRVMTHPESAVQRGVVRFCRRVVGCDFELAAHDRSAEHGENSHIYEAARGYRRDWPDVELVLDGGGGFRCELKAPGVQPKKDGGQLRMIVRLNRLGHPASWANSVMMFAEKAHAHGVPLLPNWRVIAAHEDELVASDIRSQEAKAAAKRAGTYKPGKSRPRKRYVTPDRRLPSLFLR